MFSAFLVDILLLSQLVDFHFPKEAALLQFRWLRLRYDSTNLKIPKVPARTLLHSRHFLKLYKGMHVAWKPIYWVRFWKCLDFLSWALLAHQVYNTLHQDESTCPAIFGLLV